MPYLLFPIAFLIGSIPFGLLLGKAKGIDIREHGSGNIGTTNVFRVLGKGPGLFCFFLDLLKGYIPVVLAFNLLQFGDRTPVPDLPFLASLRQTLPASEQLFVQIIHVTTALCAILGHNYSPWLGFKGGKGIATTAGVLFALIPAGAIILIALFGIVTFTTKYVSLGSLAAAITLTFLPLIGSWYHGRLQDGTWNKPLFVLCLVSGLMGIWKHKTNIKRLMNGTENRIGQKKASSET